MDKKLLIGLAVVGGGLAFYFMRKKDDAGAAPNFVPSDEVRSSTQQIVSMGSDQKQTVADLTKQIEDKAIVSGEGGTEKQASGSGSVSADPKQQLKLLSQRDLEDAAMKDEMFSGAIAAATPYAGPIAEEIERRSGSELRSKMGQLPIDALREAAKAVQRGEGFKDTRPGQLRLAWNYIIAEISLRAEGKPEPTPMMQPMPAEPAPRPQMPRRTHPGVDMGQPGSPIPKPPRPGFPNRPPARPQPPGYGGRIGRGGRGF